MKVLLISLAALLVVAAALPAHQDDDSNSSGSGSGLPSPPGVPPEIQAILKVCQEDYAKCPEAWSNYRPTIPNFQG